MPVIAKLCAAIRQNASFIFRLCAGTIREWLKALE